MFFSLVSSAATEAVGCVRSLVFGCLRGSEARLDGAWACLTWWVAQPVAGGCTEMSFKSLPARAFL